MRNRIEKAIAAAVEPLIDDIIALEKRVEQLQRALEQLGAPRRAGEPAPVSIVPTRAAGL